MSKKKVKKDKRKKKNEKNNIIMIIGIIIIVLLCGMLISSILFHGNAKGVIVIGKLKDKSLPKYFVFTNQNILNDYLDSDKIKTDFSKYHYVYVPITYDECGEKNPKIKKYYVKNNILNIDVSYWATCGGCAGYNVNYIIPIEKKINKIDVNINADSINHPDCFSSGVKKPLIYLYPEETTDISVKLGNPHSLTTTYPKYQDEWFVKADNEGNLVDSKTGKSYYGLYWEGKNHETSMKKDGFVVKRENTSKFLEEKLSILGLNEREAEEFIIYWLPVLEKNPYNYIRFESEEEINHYMPLNINPKPDTIIRILMDYKPLEHNISIKQQNLIEKKRIGFTVVEWGGTLITD